MKKIMILGASILQLPAIIKAKEMGLQTIVVDMDKNALGFKEADMCLEISTIDIPKVVDAAKKNRINGIMTLASDMPMRTVAAVAKELSLVGISEDTALKATNKVMMRGCFKEHSVPIPIFFKANTYSDYLTAINKFNGKCIVKPADNSGSRGVFLVNDIEKETIRFAFEYSKSNSRSGEIIVEEYMNGPEVSVETLSIDGEVHVIQITDKLTTGAPRFVEMGHSQPTHHTIEIAKQIKKVASTAVKAIGIENGPSHTEIMVTKDGPKVVELGARLGGDCITTHLVPLSTGVDMVECCIRIALGEKADITPKFNKGSAIRYFNSYAGVIESIQGVEEAEMIEGVKQIGFVKAIGEIIPDIGSSSDRIGFVISQNESNDAAIMSCEDAILRIIVTIISDKYKK